MLRWVPTAVVATLMMSIPAFGAETPPSAEPAPEAPSPAPESPAEKARRGVDLLLEALEGWVRQFPSYAPPEFTPEGDIIIRRLDRPGAPPPANPPPPGGGTRL
ncbi:hypothetical protein [Azospirillum halopraeferens]|uniref:hypothetical protein n=1 Tax=Azospirillum halopraeferens TaxID=34010 RepID=UPI00048F2FCB|nr:hypothetical protein [Azospirillum halopraeferens]